MKPERAYIGNIDQLLNVKTMRLEGGMAQSVLATEIQCQSGLSFTILADRCMDIASLRYKGINISYLNPCGIVAPVYYDRRDIQWLKSFTGGFLTTCGLENTGSPCRDEGKCYGMHGRISHIPAQGYAVQRRENNGENMVEVSGEMNQSSLFGEKLKLERIIRAWQKSPRIEITDTICNCGFTNEEFMILYHCNIGYPFLSPVSRVVIDSRSVLPRNKHSERYIGQVLQITEPEQGEEMCYYHEMNDCKGISRAGIYQPEFEFGLVLSYENQILRKFTQWKNMSEGEYVLGLEPGSNWVEGKAVERKRDQIQSLDAGERISYTLSIEIIEGEDQFQEKMSGGV